MTALAIVYLLALALLIGMGCAGHGTVKGAFPGLVVFTILLSGLALAVAVLA